MSNFTWIPIYEELAVKLLEYKDKRKELIEFIFSDEGLKKYSDYLHLRDKTHFIDDIDPFSFMGMFNRGSLSAGNRKSILSIIKEKFNIVSNIPSDFDGIPVLNYRRMFFYDWDDPLGSCNTLWKSYEDMMNDSLQLWFNYYKFNTRIAECTMPLFWCKPNVYIALDSRNTKYLEQNGITVNVSDTDSYLKLLQEIKNKMGSNELKEKSFAEISYNAWKKVHYWVINHSWGEASDEDVSILINQAIKNKYVFMQYEYGKQQKQAVSRTYKKALKINIGDIVFLRGKGFIYAYGTVIAPRKNCSAILTLQEIIDNKICDYTSSTSHDIIHFSDAPAFYFDFTEGEEKWGERIDIKEWTKFEKEIDISNIKNKFIAQNSYDVIREITEDSANEIMNNKGKAKMSNYSEIVSLLESKKSIILQGAPGTGKTYATAEIALSILGHDTTQYQSHKDLMDAYSNLCIKNDDSGNILSGQIGFVTFHQSMDYEDFVEGIKPKTDGDGNVAYNVEDGIFKAIANKAKYRKSSNFEDAYASFIADISDYDNEKPFKLTTPSKKEFAVSVNGNSNLSLYTGKSFHKNGVLTKANIIKQIQGEEKFKGWEGYFHGVIDCLASKYGYKEQAEEHKNYVLIIDEINRGNISKIFGELITLLESDKRIGGDHPLKVILPYSKEEFGVPSNLYIIGTMNTTDRSVGNIDYAVRRRFSFVTLEADRETVLNLNKGDEESTAVKLFDAVRFFLDKNKYDMDIDDLMVGHSYFLIKDDSDLQLKWRYEIIPLLREYYKDGIIKSEVPKSISIDEFIRQNIKKANDD